ncbi:MAG: hypothetical protein ABIN89_05010 [Chitinophagaceae bacterium]
MTDSDFKTIITILLIIIFMGGISGYYILLLIKLRRIDKNKPVGLKEKFQDCFTGVQDASGSIKAKSKP